jgi:hypothetical protein
MDNREIIHHAVAAKLLQHSAITLWLTYAALSVRPRCAAVKVGRRVLSTFVASLQLMMLLPDRHFSRRPLRGIVVGACLRTVP